MDEKLEHPAAAEQTHTRREFIRKALIKTAYAAPVIATFSVANVAAGKSPSGPSSPMRMMTKMQKMSKIKGKGTLW